MAKYRKLGRTSAQRKALLRSQVTSLLYHGKIVTTETKAKEVRKIAEGLIAMAVREKDNFETVTVSAKVPRKDENGKRVKEVVDGKKKTVYDEVKKEIKKDSPSRLHARRQMLKVFYPRSCYEVSEDVIEQFRQNFSEDLWEKLYDIKENGKYQLDLWEANRQILLEAGVSQERILTPRRTMLSAFVIPPETSRIVKAQKFKTDRYRLLLSWMRVPLPLRQQTKVSLHLLKNIQEDIQILNIILIKRSTKTVSLTARA